MTAIQSYIVEESLNRTYSLVMVFWNLRVFGIEMGNPHDPIQSSIRLYTLVIVRRRGATLNQYKS